MEILAYIDESSEDELFLNDSMEVEEVENEKSGEKDPLKDNSVENMSTHSNELLREDGLLQDDSMESEESGENTPLKDCSEEDKLVYTKESREDEPSMDDSMEDEE